MQQSVERVEGWLSPGAIGLLGLIGQIQEDNGIGGDVFEIGCHHGKSAVVLGFLIDASRESLGVCDIFNQQELNISRSGHGDREIFTQNMDAVFPECDFLHIYEKSSQTLTREEIGGDYRIFHIDGGHTVDEVTYDLELAAQCLQEGGAIICDDALHPGWPTVAEAIFRFLFEHPGEFSVLAIGFNKMVIIPSKAKTIYQTYLEIPDICWRYIPQEETRGIRRVALCGGETYCFIPKTWEGVTA